MMDNTTDLDTDDDARSTDSINITTVKERVIDDDRICYLCANAEGGDDVYDRSDLMDGGRHQKLVLTFERKTPPTWDLMCPTCDNEGCEECECPDCERTCRFYKGVNYGCELHPVV